MERFEFLDGLVAPIDRANVDTDAIIPKQFLKSVKRSGFGDNLFDAWRYLDDGAPGMPSGNRPLNLDFVLNRPCYQQAQILVVRENFGCGSSREHAVWALLNYGIRVVIGPSFADIFYNNCFKNGLLPIVLGSDEMALLFDVANAGEGIRLAVDLHAQTIQYPGGQRILFSIEAFRKTCLLEGLDEIALTLSHADDIRSYEHRRRLEAPWLFMTPASASVAVRTGDK